MNPNQLNIDILRAFGVDTKCVTQADIQLRPNKYPEVNVTMVPWPLEPVGAMLKSIALRCHLVPPPAAAPEPAPAPPPLDIEAMCNTARQCVRIAIEWAGDDAKDALLLRSARYNQAHGLPLSSAHLVALAAEVRKTLGVLKQLHKGLVSFEEACAQLDLPELPVFHIDPTSKVTNWEPTHPTKWAPRRFGWDEGGSNA